MDDFERELKQGFLEEAAQAVSDVEQCFLILETHPDDKATLDKIFRLAHNLKGSAKAVGFDDMGTFTHELESFMLSLKTGQLDVNPAVVSLLLRCNDHISQMIEGLRSDLDAKFDSQDLISEIKNAASGGLSHGAGESSSNTEVESTELENTVVEEEFSISPEEVSMATHLPEDIVEASSHVEGAVPMATVTPIAQAIEKKQNQQSSNQPAKAPPQQSAADESIRVSLSRVEKLLNFVGELVILQAVLKEQVSDSSNLLVKKTVHQLGKVTKEVQDMSMSLRMVPVKPTFQKMQRIVRDTAQALNKNIQLTLVGEETELDKTVLERINDPLVHLVRNSVDHGVETADRRLAAGKSDVGHVTLSAYHSSGRLVIEVKDDGGGLDAEKLKSIAIKKGILKPNAELTEKEAWALIFAPGFSTKQEVTDISGRGVGMDVVRTNIEELNGEIQIESELGKGTTFKIYLPLTLAIIDGMVIKMGNDRYVIPLAHVHESIRPQEADLKQTTGLGEIFMLRGENLPLYRLGHLLGKRETVKVTDGIAIVVRTGDQPFALLVDDIIGQYQVVIKQLGAEVQIKGFSGSTILGDGKPALILEPADLVRRDVKLSGKATEIRRSI